MFNPSDQHMGDWMKPGNFFGTPVDYEAKDMNPWRKSSLQIALGIALYTISIEYLMLERFLPLAGVILMYLGLRTLREESRWFFIGNLLVSAEGLWVLTDLFFTGSALNTAFHQSAAYTVGHWVTRLMQLGMLLCLRQGLSAVFVRSGRLPRVKWVTVLMALYAAAAALQLLPAGYLLIGIYAGILWVLYRLAKALDGVGYEVFSTPAALSDTVLTFLFVGLAVAAMLGGTYLLSRYPMDWTAHTVTEEQSRIAGELTENPAVRNALTDLTPEDILACRGGKVELWNSDSYACRNSELGSREMTVTTLYVRLQGEGNRWKVIHHFRWTDMVPPTFHYGTESFVVYLDEMAEKAENFTGQVLCRAGQKVLGADPAEIVLASYTRVGLFMNLSFPKKAEGARGYVSYELTLDAGESLADHPAGEICYLFQNIQTDEFRYPAVSCQEQEMNGGNFNRYSGFYRFEKIKEAQP